MSDSHGKNGFELHDGPALVWAQRAAFVTILGLGALVTWSLTASVDEVAKARGSVAPISQVRPVESQHGGKVAAIVAELGAHVEKGDLLVIFAETEAKASRDAAVAKLAGFQMEIERLTSLVERKAANFSPWESNFPALVSQELAALQAQIAFLEAERSEIRARIEAKHAEITAIDARLPELNMQITSVQGERARIGQLVEKGLATTARQSELIESEAKYNFQLDELAGRRAISNSQLIELQASLSRLDLEETAKARARIAEALGAERALEADIAALEQRLTDVEVHAPISGFVQSLPDERTGDIVDPGGLVATIVPAEGGLRFTGRLSPRDIGFVELGQPVRVKIDSFDFSRYGAVTGVVEELSPTTTVDERGTAFYEVRIALDRTFFRQETDGLVLLPGMTGEADIRTGSKTVFQYVWKPVFTNLDLALTER